MNRTSKTALLWAIALFNVLLVGMVAVNAGVPILMNYQAELRRLTGEPLDTTISMTFTIYDDSTGGSPLWTETHGSVDVNEGLFSVILGTYNAARQDTIFHDPERYLGITIGSDPEIEPRTRLVSAPYAFHSRSVVGFHSGPNNVDSGKYTVVGGDSNTVLGDYHVVTGGYGNSATGEYEAPGDSIIAVRGGGFRYPPPLSTGAVVCGGYDNDAWGVASGVVSGAGNDALGALSFVGAGAHNRAYHFASVGGGGFNYASGLGSSIGGGGANEAQGVFSTIAGGGFTTYNDPTTANIVYDNYGTIGGGGNNKAGSNNFDVEDDPFTTISGGESNYAGTEYSTIGGGYLNQTIGIGSTISGGRENQTGGAWSVIPGGRENITDGQYSLAAGYQAAAWFNNSFVWNDGAAGQWGTTGDNQFLIHADGGVGINEDDPEAQLHVNDALTTNGQTAVKVDFQSPTSSIGVRGIEVTPSMLGVNGTQIGVTSQMAVNSSNQIGTTEGRLGRISAWAAYGALIGVEGLTDVSSLDNDPGPNSWAVGGRFVTNSSSNINITDVSGTYYVGGAYGEIGDQINTGPGVNAIVAGIIGVDNNATGSATSYAGYFDGKVNITDVLHLEPTTFWPSSPSEGDIIIYNNGLTNNIYCYLNGVWQAL